MLFNYLVDYQINATGEYMHTVMQVDGTGTPWQVMNAVRIVYQRKGLRICSAMYVPGNHSISDLQDMQDFRLPIPGNAETVFVNYADYGESLDDLFKELEAKPRSEYVETLKEYVRRMEAAGRTE